MASHWYQGAPPFRSWPGPVQTLAFPPYEQAPVYIRNTRANHFDGTSDVPRQWWETREGSRWRGWVRPEYSVPQAAAQIVSSGRLLSRNGQNLDREHSQFVPHATELPPSHSCPLLYCLGTHYRSLDLCTVTWMPGLLQELCRSCMRMPKFIFLQYRHMARPYDWNPGVEHGTRQGSASVAIPF